MKIDPHFWLLVVGPSGQHYLIHEKYTTFLLVFYHKSSLEMKKKSAIFGLYLGTLMQKSSDHC